MSEVAILGINIYGNHDNGHTKLLNAEVGVYLPLLKNLTPALAIKIARIRRDVWSSQPCSKMFSHSNLILWNEQSQLLMTENYDMVWNCICDQFCPAEVHKNVIRIVKYVHEKVDVQIGRQLEQRGIIGCIEAKQYSTLYRILRVRPAVCWASFS